MHTVVARGDRRVRNLALSTVLLFVGGVVGAVTVKPSSADESRLVAAAAATARTGTARVAMTSKVSVGGSDVTGKGEGVADFAAEKASMTMDLPGAGGTMRVVTVGKVAYLQGSVYQPIAQGKQWVSIDVGQFVQGFGATSGGGADVLSALRALEDDGVVRDVREVGADEVRGVRTVQYTGDYEPDALLRQLTDGNEGMREMLRSVRMSAASVSVWVSDDDLVRRVVTTTTMTVGGTSLDSTTTIDLFDFGIPVQIDVPPADQVHRLEFPLRAAG
ncbi:MAG TPA: hypothetical protein VGB03_05620 [Acidimicrobiales bacterium]